MSLCVPVCYGAQSEAGYGVFPVDLSLPSSPVLWVFSIAASLDMAAACYFFLVPCRIPPKPLLLSLFHRLSAPTMATTSFQHLAMVTIAVSLVLLPTPSLSFHPPLHQTNPFPLYQNPVAPSSYAYRTLFFSQTLDHFSFSPSSFQTFQQRYLLSTQFWGGATRQAPIFVYCGNEGDITWFAQNTGFLWETAPRFQAMVVFLEHRYYGESIPGFALTNQTAETLAYLTSEQALADYGSLILDLKKNFSAEESPVVVFGGSYGGMLAAWFRLKYPHIAIGALSASAPILQFDHLVPWDGFYRIVSEDFKGVSVNCFETIKSSWNELTAAYQQSGGTKTVKEKFNFCSNVSVDLGSLENFLYAAWIYLAMTDYPFPANFLMPLPGNPVKAACEAMDALPEDADTISRIAAGANVYYNGSGQVQCFQFGSNSHGTALWNWQACTEMVMPMTSNPNNSMFPAFSFDWNETARLCKNFYGVDPRPHWITQEFGGHDIRRVLKRFGSNIIFSNGLLDPWSNGGVLESISDSVVALVTAKGAHHLDLRASTPDDPEWLIEQRTSEREHIARWLRQFYADQAAHNS